MADTQKLEMHPSFPRWYREVDVEEKRDRLHGRWNGIAALIPTLDRSDTEALVRLAFKTKAKPSADVVVRIRSVFKDADETFDMEDNDREMEVLAGSTLVVVMDKNDDLSASAALTISTSSLAGTRPLALPMDLAGIAEQTIARVAEENRARPNLQDMRLEPPTLTFGRAKEKLAAIDGASILAMVDGMASAINTTLGAVAKKVNSFVSDTATFISIQDEELEMLWWVLGERSDGAQKPFASIPEKERPLIFAAELAKATAFLPGPLSIDGLLGRAGLKPKTSLSIADAVNACDREWLRRFVLDEAFSSVSQPIHLAIQRRLESDDDVSWISGWSGTCGIDAAKTFPSLTVSRLFYRECLLSNF